MDDRSIFWILTLGVILIQAPRSNANVFRRNLNSNMNTNSNMMEPTARIYRTTRRPPMYDQDNTIEYISPRDTYPRSFRADSDPANVAAVATAAAADATLSVTKNLAEDMSETAAIAVADAVSKILGIYRRRPGSGRRSSNINTNYNYNLLGPPSLTDAEDRETILQSDVSQSKDSSAAVMQDFPANTDKKRYLIVPGREIEPSKWSESRYGDREWELRKSDYEVRPSRCRYQPSVCRMRRTGRIEKMELMDDHANDPAEGTETSDLVGEVDGLDVDKEFSEDDKDDDLSSGESLDAPANVTALVKPVTLRRDQNRNHNQNLNNLDSRRFIIRAPKRRPPPRTRRPPLQFPKSG